MLEPLEDRTLLSTSIPLNSTSWTAIGPAPINVPNAGSTGPAQPLAGRITGVAADPNNPSTIYVTAAGGGVWKTTDGAAHWTPQTDSQTTLSMGAIALDAHNPNIIYAGTGEANNSGDSFYGRGVLKSEDGGAHWILVSQFELDPQTGKVLTDSNGNPIRPFDRMTISKIVVTNSPDPAQANDVYVAVAGGGANGVSGETGIFKSTDGGVSWTNTTASISKTDAYTDLVESPYPSTANTFYAAIGTRSGSARNGVYVTVDGGANWNPAGDFPMGTADGRIALANSSNNYHLYFAALSDTNGRLYKLMYTTNGDYDHTQIHWEQVTLDPSLNYLGTGGWYATALAISPKFYQTQSNGGSVVETTYTVYGGGQTQVVEVNVTERFVYDSGGNLLQDKWNAGTYDLFNGTHVTPKNIVTTQAVALNGKTINEDLPHDDHHAFVFDANGTLLDGNDGGLWRWTPASSAPGSSGTWADLNGNLQITQFTGIALDPNNPNVAYGGSQDNGTEKFNDALQWNWLQDGDGGFVRVDPNNPNTVYHTFYRDSTDGTTFFERSDDGGATWSAKTTGINPADPSNFYVPYVMDPSNPSRLLLGTNRIYETTTRGDATTQPDGTLVDGWHPISAPFSANVDAIAVSRSDPNTIYATAGGRIFVTTDDGAHWAERDISGATDHFADLEVDPANSQIAYAVRDRFNNGSNSGHVFRTTDGGQTWTDISSNLPDLPTNTVALFPGTSTLYVGNDQGVYVSKNLGGSWSRFGTGLPDARAVDLELNTTLGILAVGTHGRGMWEIQVENDPPPIPTGNPLTTTEGRAFSGVVATFTDADPNATAGEYTATISWGDGSSSAGTIQGGSAGFSILGTHTYAEEGTYPIGVAITDVDNSDNGATTTSSATVADAQLTASYGVIGAVEGAAFSGVVATFTDADPNGMVADYAAMIDWGDGQQSAGTVAANGGGFTVSGTHTYAEEGNRAVTVTIVDHGDGRGLGDATDSKATTTSPATVADAPLTATGQAINAVEEAAFAGAVASFTDADPNGVVSDYAATIDWGDGQQSGGTVVANGAGGFDVQGTHTYAEEGDNYAVTVTVVDHGDGRGVGDPSDSTATAHSTAKVQDAPLTAGNVNIGAVEGAAFTGIIATFTDADPQGMPADYKATTIDWGDGNAPTGADAIVANGAGGFNVQGTHTYAEEGNYAVTVTVIDNGDGRGGADPGNSIGTAHSAAKVVDAMLNAKAQTFGASAGAPFSGTVASFTDDNPKAPLADFSATIEWGDGVVGQGVIVPDGLGGFDVNGTHTYTDPGTYTVTVDITDVGGSTATAVSTAQVQQVQVDPPISAQGADVGATEGAQTGTVTVATFTDPDPTATAGEYQATVDWGDGSPASAGTITAKAGGGFTVTGSHTYAEEGTYQLKVKIVDVDNASNTAVGTGSAKVADAPLAPDYANLRIILTGPGETFTDVVASFTDADPNGTAGDYTATIDWGDGSSSAGGVTADKTGGFNVAGSHDYAREGLFLIGVTITDAGGSTTTAIDIALVFAGLFGSGPLGRVAQVPLDAAAAGLSHDGSALTLQSGATMVTSPTRPWAASRPADETLFVAIPTGPSIVLPRMPPAQAQPQPAEVTVPWKDLGRSQG
jgi:hypothetical protein